MTRLLFVLLCSFLFASSAALADSALATAFAISTLSNRQNSPAPASAKSAPKERKDNSVATPDISGVTDSAQALYNSFSAITETTQKNDAFILSTAARKTSEDSSDSSKKKSEVVSPYYLGLIRDYGDGISVKDPRLEKAADSLLAQTVAAGDAGVGAEISKAAALSAGRLRVAAAAAAEVDAKPDNSIAGRIARGDVGGGRKKLAVSGNSGKAGGFGYTLSAKKPKAPTAIAGVREPSSN